MSEFTKRQVFDAIYDSVLNAVLTWILAAMFAKSFKVNFGLPMNGVSIVKCLLLSASANVLVRYLQIKKYVASNPT